MTTPAQDEQVPRILVDRDGDLLREMRAYLDGLIITRDTIGDIRQSLFVPWSSLWNGWVRDETAKRERSEAVRSASPTTKDPTS